MSNGIIADCCGGENWEYMLIAQTWHFVLWVATAQKGDETTWKAMSFPAEFCHSCGGRLERADMPRRNYFAGVFAPIDSIVDAVIAKLSDPSEPPARGINAYDADIDVDTPQNLDPADFNERSGVRDAIDSLTPEQMTADHPNLKSDPDTVEGLRP